MPYQFGLMRCSTSDDGDGSWSSDQHAAERGGGEIVATRVAGLVDHSIDVRVYLPRPPCGSGRVGAGGTLRRQRGRAGRDEDEESDSRILLRRRCVDGGRIEPSWGGKCPDGSGDPNRLAVYNGRHGRQRRRQASGHGGRRLLERPSSGSLKRMDCVLQHQRNEVARRYAGRARGCPVRLPPCLVGTGGHLVALRESQSRASRLELLVYTIPEHQPGSDCGRFHGWMAGWPGRGHIASIRPQVHPDRTECTVQAGHAAGDVHARVLLAGHGRPQAQRGHRRHERKLERNLDYFTADATVRAKYPTNLALRVPKVDSIIYRLYRNVQATVFALQAGTLDFIDWTVPPDQVAPITGDPNIGLKSSADAGVFYQSFNFDRLPFGYLNPAEGSNTPGNHIGKPFRLAVADATDKRTIVTSLLQNFGVAGHTVVSPTNTLYYNASAPRYEFDPSVARGILDAAYGVWPGGVCQQDGTGCRSLPGKGTGAIDMLTPQADYDPIRASAGTLIAQNMRAIGVNMNSKATAFGAIVDALDARNFDMWILGWSLTGYVEPGYIESFFHSRNAPIPGQNYESYVNTSLDTIIDDATGAVGTQAVQLWKWAQGAILQDAVYNVLYFRTTVFAFRQDRINPASFRTDIGGDVWIYWSRILLEPAPPGVIRSAASLPSAVGSGGSAPITVTVRDSGGKAVPGALVNISRTSGLGTVSPSTGTTNANGQFAATFTAPTLTAGATPVSTFLEIQSTSSEFGAARLVTVVITTFPPGAQFLTLLAETPFGNVINEGGTGAIDVTVSGENGQPAAGANVILTPSPAITLTPSTFTLDATGHQQVTISAPTVAADTTYTITITATRGSVSGTSQMTLTVLNVPPSPGGGGLDTRVVLLIGGAVVGTGAAGGIYVGLRRRGRKKP